MNDITSKWSRLSLRPKETQTVPLISNPTGDGKVLVAMFFTKRHLNMEAVFRTLKSMWKTEKSFDIRDLGSNTVMIVFDDELDLDHILMRGPWSFDKLLGLYKPGKNEAIKNAKFDRESFWVLVHDLPIQHMSKANAEAIGSTLGIVEQVYTGPTGDCRGRCLRVRVNVDISQPLCRGRMVDIGDSSPSWVSFQYERMPIFCYWCGILNHNEKDCKLWIRSQGTLRKDEQEYGAWLRASNDRPLQPYRGFTPTATATLSDKTNTTASETPVPPAINATCTGDKETAEISKINAHQRIPTNAEILKIRLDFLWHLVFHQHVGDEVLGPSITIAWSLWKNRNTARTGGSRQPSPLILQTAVRLIEEYRLANHKITVHNVVTNTTWSPPQSPWYKVNVDGAIFCSPQAVGVGVVARDHTGQSVAAMSKKMWVPLGPLEAEAKAMEEAIDFAWNIGLQDVIFECDSEVLHGALTGNTIPSAAIANVVSSCLARLQDFRSVQFSHVRRQGNNPAHTLAHYAKSLETFVTWIEDNPSPIEHALARDVMFIA